jgi:hypothetical protein
MKPGDLVIHDGKEIGIVDHVWDNGDIDVWFSDGEYQVDGELLEVINESR